MQRKFLVNLGFLLLLNLLVKPFYIFGVDAQIQNELGTTYGNYFALLNLSFLFNIILDLGINNYNTTQIAQHPHLGKKNVVRIVNLRTLLFVVYLGITLSVALVSGYQEQDFLILGVLVFNQFLVGMNQYFSSNFKGFHQFKIDALFSVLDRIVLIALCLMMLYGNLLDSKITIMHFVIAQSIAYGTSFLFGIAFTLKNGIDLRRFWSWKYNRHIVKRSLPYAFLILLMMLYSRVDSVMLERISGDRSAADYAQGYRILDAFNMFALLFASLLLPIFARSLRDKIKLEETVEIAAKLLILLGIGVTIGIVFFGDTILNSLYTDVNASSKACFQYLIFGFLGMTITYVFGTLLTAKGSLKGLNILAFISLLLNIILNLILIPKYEAKGAAIATCITQLFMGIAQLILAQYIFKFRVNTPLILRFLVFSIVIAALGWALDTYSGMGEWWLIGIFGVAALFGSIAFKILEPKAVLKIIKEKEVD